MKLFMPVRSRTFVEVHSPTLVLFPFCLERTAQEPTLDVDAGF